MTGVQTCALPICGKNVFFIDSKKVAVFKYTGNKITCNNSTTNITVDLVQKSTSTDTLKIV